MQTYQNLLKKLLLQFLGGFNCILPQLGYVGFGEKVPLGFDGQIEDESTIMDVFQNLNLIPYSDLTMTVGGVLKTGLIFSVFIK